MKKNERNESATAIRRDEVYRLTDFMRITGMTTSAVREARRAGLAIRRAGKRSFIIGADFVKFIENSPIVDGRGELAEVAHAS